MEELQDQEKPTNSKEEEVHFPSSSIWENLTTSLKQEAINQFKLVNLFKQINPDLHVCPKEATTSRPGLMASKGVQVPDRRLPFRNSRPPPSKDRSEFVGRGYRIFSSRFAQTNLRRSSSLAERSSLRADAPPHVPDSVRRRVKSDQPSQDISSASNKEPKDVEDIDSEEVFTDEKQERKLEKENGNADLKDGEEINKNPLKSVEEHNHYKLVDYSESSKDDGEIVETDNGKACPSLERRWGYFFCRCCLHGWVSSNVWCIQGSEKVYIKQTCNFCNEVVLPQVGGKYRVALFSEKWTPAKEVRDSDGENYFSF